MTGRLIACVSLLIATAGAQIQTGASDVAGHVRVRVEFSDRGPCDPSTRVALNGGRNFAPTESAVNAECVAEFFDVPTGEYRVTVSGPDAANADQGEIEVNRAVSQNVEVRAVHSEMHVAHYWPASSFISAADLAMPSNAAKEFKKADRLIAKQEWTKATDRLRKGLAIYPRSAAAYNNLGALYSHLGNAAEAREALQQAIALDGRMAPAYVNLGRLSFLEKDFPNTESLLTKAVSLEPAQNADELFLLAYAQLSDHHLEDALQTSREAHVEKFDHHGSLHLLAANVYERQNKIQDCIAELRLYLHEEPSGVSAAQCRPLPLWSLFRP